MTAIKLEASPGELLGNGRNPPTAAVADAARTRKDPVGKQVISDRQAMRGFGTRFETQNMHDKSCRNG